VLWSVQEHPDSQAPVPVAPFVPGEIIVSVQPGIQADGLRAGQLLRVHGADAEFVPAIQAWQLYVPAGQEEATVRRLRADPAVAYAELNYLVFTQ
jgi:hypothetical protein